MGVGRFGVVLAVALAACAAEPDQAAPPPEYAPVRTASFTGQYRTSADAAPYGPRFTVYVHGAHLRLDGRRVQGESAPLLAMVRTAPGQAWTGFFTGPDAIRLEVPLTPADLHPRVDFFEEKAFAGWIKQPVREAVAGLGCDVYRAPPDQPLREACLTETGIPLRVTEGLGGSEPLLVAESVRVTDFDGAVFAAPPDYVRADMARCADVLDRPAACATF